MGGFVHAGEALSVVDMLDLNADLHPEIFTTEAKPHGIQSLLSQAINIGGSSAEKAVEDLKVAIFSPYHMVFAS